MKPKCVVALALPNELLAHLAEHYEVLPWTEAQAISEAELVNRLPGAQGLLCTLTSPVTPAMIEVADRLKVISTISVGVDHIDLLAASRAAIPVGHTPGVLVDSTADLTLALMLAVTRRVAEADRWIRAGHWTDGWQSDLLLGTDISQATIGIVGLGPIGEAVVTRLKGFGCRVLTWNRTPKQVPGAEPVALDALFAQSDMVSLHTALTQETTHIASRARLASMPSGSSLINTGRGLLVDEAALIDEVQSGRLKAGLDVFVNEPLPVDHPFKRLDNVVVLPHVGSATAATRDAMVARAFDNLHAGLAGQRVPFCANPEVYEVEG